MTRTPTVLHVPEHVELRFNDAVDPGRSVRLVVPTAQPLRNGDKRFQLLAGDPVVCPVRHSQKDPCRQLPEGTLDSGTQR